jgi:hypothetical protein
MNGGLGIGCHGRFACFTYFPTPGRPIINFFQRTRPSFVAFYNAVVHALGQNSLRGTTSAITMHPYMHPKWLMKRSRAAHETHICGPDLNGSPIGGPRSGSATSTEIGLSKTIIYTKMERPGPVLCPVNKPWTAAGVPRLRFI